MKNDTIHTDFIDVGGRRIHYYHAGQSGSPLVLLHGGGVDSAWISWEELIAPLAAGHRVLVPDLPGYGQSDKPDVAYTLEFYLEFLERFLEALGITRASLAGLSLGGGIALGFTLQHPHRVDKLVLVDSYGLQSRLAYHKLSYLYVFTPLNELSYWLLRRNRDLLRQSLQASIYDPANITPQLLDAVERAIRDPFAGRAFTSFQRSELRWNGLRSDFSSRLHEVHTPTLILHGDHDVTVPVQDAERAHQRIAGSQYVLLKNRRHWALRDHPEEIVAILLRFLEENAGDGA
jgi:pimeloyl-ACP methyl ester carboxylesterase